MADVVQLIKGQHRQIDELLGQAEQAEPEQVAELLRQVADLLVPHSEAEESFVYPAIREHDTGETEDVHDSVAEHQHVDGLLQELLGADPSEAGFDGKLAAMIGELRHHVEEEETTLLPVLEQQADDDERAELGARFAEATGQESSGSGRTARSSGGGGGGGGRGAGRGAGGGEGRTRDELYQEAKEQQIPGRSAMTKEELARALDENA